MRLFSYAIRLGLAVSFLALTVACATMPVGGLPGSVRDVVKKTLPSVVKVDVVETVTQKQPGSEPAPFFDYFFDNPDDQEPKKPKDFRSESLGSGVIVRSDGRTYYVLTNAHVIEGADTIRVTLDDGREFQSKLIGKDPRRDLALVTFESPESLPVVAMGDSTTLSVGDWVIAIGSPYGYQSTVTLGIVSAVNRRGGPGDTITDFIQTDAAINKGNSGGALLNLQGELVGINTWISSQSGGSIGLGFAVPSNQTRKVINDLIKFGVVKAAWLGVSMFSLDRALAQDYLGLVRKGTLVTSLYAGSPAALAGIKLGDVLISLEGRALDVSDLLVQEVGGKEVGSKINLEVLRDGKPLTVTVTLAERKTDSELAKENARIWPGFAVYPLSTEIRRDLGLDPDVKGVLVRQVIARSAAEQAGMVFGEVLSSIDGQAISDIKSFFDAVNRHDRQKPMVLSLSKSGKTRELEVTYPQ